MSSGYDLLGGKALVSSTGPIETWNVNPLDVGPIYPFLGWEVLMVAACGLFFVVFLVWKIASENSKFAASVQRLHEAEAKARSLKGAKSTGNH